MHRLGGHVVGVAQGLSHRSPLIEVLAQMPGSEQRQPEPHFPTVLVSEVLEVQRFKSDSKLNVSVLQPGVLTLRPSPPIDCDSALTIRSPQRFQRTANLIPIQVLERLERLVIEWRPRRATREQFPPVPFFYCLPADAAHRAHAQSAPRRLLGSPESRDLYCEPVGACPTGMKKLVSAERLQCFALSARGLDHGPGR